MNVCSRNIVSVFKQEGLNGMDVARKKRSLDDKAISDLLVCVPLIRPYVSIYFFCSI